MHEFSAILNDANIDLFNSKKFGKKSRGSMQLFCLAALHQMQKELEKNRDFSSHVENDEAPGQIVVVVKDSIQVQRWYNQLQDASSLFFSESAIENRILMFQSLTFWGSERYSNFVYRSHLRLRSMTQIVSAKSPLIVVLSPAALAQLTLTREALLDASFVISRETVKSYDELISMLKMAFYTEVDLVSRPGQFCTRGAILDVYPVTASMPLRCEFWGDELTSLREFSLHNQISTNDISHYYIGPVRELDRMDSQADRSYQAQVALDWMIEQRVEKSQRDRIIDEILKTGTCYEEQVFLPLWRKDVAPGLSLFSSKSTFIFPDSLSGLSESLSAFFYESQLAIGSDREQGKLSLDYNYYFQDLPILQTSLAKLRCLSFNENIEEDATINYPNFLMIDDQVQKQLDFGYFIEKVLAREDLTSVSYLLTCSDEHELARLEDLFKLRDVSTQKLECPLTLGKEILFQKKRDVKIFLCVASINEVIFFESEQLVLLSEQFFFGKKRRQLDSAKNNIRSFINSQVELEIGDAVVHTLYGIGIYQGLETLEIGETKNDFVKINYRGDDRIYLPVDRLSLLQKYGSAVEGTAIDKLGDDRWQKRKSGAKSAAREIAEKLLKIYAQRGIAQAHSFGPVCEEYLRFAAEFPYQETPDQISAIEDIEADFNKSILMDRLVCGDVGFGKTEVAMRAAMRVVLEGLQVMVLVPTTILSFQHFQTFSKRMAHFGVRIGQLNRFVSRKNALNVLEQFSAGKIDVLIGTHRILSEDIKSKNLGLLIIDEEQRFGVAHKEKIKGLKANTHILTLTATPIPRTLHLSMLGLRDISIIATPPQNRISIKTYVTSYDEQIVQQAIINEVNRGGQIFYVHNRVQDIANVYAKLKALFPELNIVIAHGQLSSQQLEKAILSFIQRKAEILIATSIIESGIDMPSVNTLIVERADLFGLAQLYQIRGRVGRSQVQAYSYFFTEKGRTSREALERLNALTTYTELGSGFQIASRDLDIRGAGDLLGAEQAGHTSDVGYDMYVELLNQAIAELKGQKIEERIDPELNLKISSIIPDNYIKGARLRFSYYKRLFSIRAGSELSEIKAELSDRFGPIPREMELLWQLATLKVTLRDLRVLSIHAKSPNRFELIFDEISPEQTDKILKAVRTKPAHFKLVSNKTLAILLDHAIDGQVTHEQRLKDLMDFLQYIS
ncbi:MAG: transcription-repair coupling factor [Oligoflexales bacterium]|nr:transcription-repair coupling factor [Oligoflexales bacterium]